MGREDFLGGVQGGVGLLQDLAWRQAAAKVAGIGLGFGRIKHLARTEGLQGAQVFHVGDGHVGQEAVGDGADGREALVEGRVETKNE